MAPDLENNLSSDVIYKGYLKKLLKTSKKKERYFVLRERPVARLEYFENEKKFNTKGSKPRRIIDLQKVWNIDRKICAKYKHIISIYTQNEYFAMAADSKDTQDIWFNCLLNVTSAAAASANLQMYKHIWQVNLDNKDIEQCNSNKYLSLQGPHRCCLTENSMILVKLDNNGNVCDLKRYTTVEIKMASIRTCGHRENQFFIEPGRSIGIGRGKLWMELDDPVIADNMHQTILGIMYSLKQDDGPRPRSFSSGSGSGRGRFRRDYHNPPPSQVGMRKPTPVMPPSLSHQFSKTRTRCESFPATQVGNLTDEARYRTYSEGETTMSMIRHLSNKFNNNTGSVSPGNKWRSRVGSFGKRDIHSHYNTFPHHGSCTSSSSMSSIDHHGLNISDGMSSDEFSSSPCDHFHRFSPGGTRSVTPDSTSSAPVCEDMSFAHCTCNHHIEQAPPPPNVPPLSLNGNTTNHEYVNMQPLHSRSHSMDDNLSCGTEASSLSTSPHCSILPNVYPMHENRYSPTNESNQTKTNVQSMDTDEYADMCLPCNSGSSILEPPSSGLMQMSDDYAIMTPGKTKAVDITNIKEENGGYVPMRPYSISKSLPQDIQNQRRTSVPDIRCNVGSYSPKSDLSRSPDKCHYSKSKTPKQSKNPVIHQKITVETPRPMSVDIDKPPLLSSGNYCSDEYALMGGQDNEMNYDENTYLPMSPMSVVSTQPSSSRGGTGLFSAVLSVAESGTKTPPQYPHQLGTGNTGSLDRKKLSSRSIKRHKSQNAPAQTTKLDRKFSLRFVAADTRPQNTAVEDPQHSLGGEYVNIDYQKALQQSSSYFTAVHSPSLLKKFKQKALGTAVTTTQQKFTEQGDYSALKYP